MAIKPRRETMLTYKETCIEHIIDTLPDWKGEEVEISELGYLLTEGENATGSWYCSTYKAQEKLKNWFNDVADFIEEYQQEFGDKPQHDAFTEPELFHCLMMIIGVEKALNETNTIQELWGENVKLTSKIIKNIIKEL